MSGLDSNTKLYLPFDQNTLGATTVDGALEVLEHGSSTKIWTSNGDATLTTSIKKFGKSSLRLQGSNDYLQANGKRATGAFTMAFWIRADAPSSQQYIYNDYGGTNSNNGFDIRIEGASGKLYVNMCDGTNMCTLLGGTVLSADTWYHVVLTWDGTTNADGMVLYVNNSSDGTATSDSATTATPTYNMTFGCAPHDKSSDFTGYLKDIRYFDHVITSGERDSIYNSGDGTSDAIGDEYTHLLMDTQDQSGDGGSGTYHVPDFIGTAQLDTAVTKYGTDTSSLLLDGNSDYVTLPDSADWDITENWTIAGWIKHDDHAGTECYLSQYVDATNYWVFEHIDGTGLQFQVDGGGADIQINGGEITDTNWHFVAVCKVGSNVGIYSGTSGNATQVADGDAACTTAFAAILSHGAENAGNFFDGNTAHWAVWASNYFGASPDGTLTDTITVPTAPYTADAPPTPSTSNLVSRQIIVTT